MKKVLLFNCILSLSFFPCFSQVGINTTSPASGVSLHVKDNFESIRLDGTSPFLSFYNGTDYRGYLYMSGDNMYMYNRKAGSMFFGTSNVNKLTITSDGDIGIGTTLPEQKLHVADGIISGGSFNSSTIAGFEKSSGNGFLSIMTKSTNESGILFADENSGQQGGIIFNNGATPDGLQFRTNNNTTQMTIDNAGDVGIGIGNPSRPLHVKSRNGGDEYGIRIDRSGSSTNWEMSVFQGNFCFFYNGAVSPTAVIATNGNYSSSDKRLKKNITHYKKVLPLIDQLQVESYEFIADAEEHKQVIGLIAQDVDKLFPEIVRKSPNRNGEIYYSIDYGKTGVLALKALQEMQEDLSNSLQANHLLEQKLLDLEKNNLALQRRLETIEARLAIAKN